MRQPALVRSSWSATPITYKQDERNWPAALLNCRGRRITGHFPDYRAARTSQPWNTQAARGRSVPALCARVQTVRANVARGEARRFIGTEIPKNFSSRCAFSQRMGRMIAKSDLYDNPLRYAGLTFYQYQMDSANPTASSRFLPKSRLVVPYIACGLMTFGLLAQFGIHLFGFAKRRVPRSGAFPAHEEIYPFRGARLGFSTRHSVAPLRITSSTRLRYRWFRQTASRNQRPCQTAGYSGAPQPFSSFKGRQRVATRKRHNHGNVSSITPRMAA